MASMFNPSLRECSYKINVNLDARNNKQPQIYALSSFGQDKNNNSKNNKRPQIYDLSSFGQDKVLWHQCLTHPSESVLTKLMPV